MRKAARCSAVLALLAVAGSSAVAAELHGVVLDASDERGLPGVRVDLGEGLLLVSSGEDGRFRADLAAGRYRLRVEHRGYALVEEWIDVSQTGLRLDVGLRRSTLSLHETVVVSARRDPGAGFETPRAVSVASAEDLQRQGARTAPEALADVAGVWVQKTNHGGGSPFVRGLAGNQVLVLVDGVRLNNSTFRYGPNQYMATIDPFSLERMEVVRGIGSVLYGSDALGGVLSVFTAQPEFSSGGTAASGRLYGKLASSDQEASGRADVQVSGPHAALRGGFSLRDFGHLRAGGPLGMEAPSGYSEQDGDVKAALRLADQHVLTAAYQHVHQSDVPRWDQVAQRGFARYTFDPQVRQLGYAQLQSSFGRRWLDSLKATGSFQRSDETRIRQSAGSPVTITERDVVDTWGWSLQGRSRPAAWTLAWGAEGYHDEVRSSRRDRDASTSLDRDRRGLYPDGAAARSLAAFADGQWRRGPWLAEGGLRYTRHRVTATDAAFGRIDVEPSAVVGSAAASFEWTRGHRLVASLQQGFRAPNVDDLSTLGLFDFGIEVPSPSLSPERALSYELGWKARTPRLAAAVSMYRTTLRDLIERVPDRFEGAEVLEGQRVYRRANVGRAYVQGLEAEAQWNAAEGLLASAHLTWTYGQVTSTDEPLRRVPPLNGLLALRWNAAPRLSVEATLRFAAKQDRLASGDRADHRIAPRGTPGWTVAGARGSFEPHPRLTVFGGIDNVFDEAFRVHGSGIDGQGRTAWLATQVRF